MSFKGDHKLPLMALLFLHGMALASWFVPLGPVLDAHQLGAIKPLAFACSAIAALISPLIVGAWADRAVAPIRLLGWISAGAGVLAIMTSLALAMNAPSWLTLLLIQLQSLFASPTSSLGGSIVFSKLQDSQRQFGPVRALGTIGWMVGCWTVSLFSADASKAAFQISGILWLGLSAITFWFAAEPPLAEPAKALTWRERMGWDALTLLRNPDHRGVIIACMLFSIPAAAFYPYTPAHLQDLGLHRTAAWMSIGQITEVLAMLGLGWLLSRWRFKHVIIAGLAFGLARYILYAIGSPVHVLLGLSFHGFAFTWTAVVAQMYLAERVEAAWRTRAQALLGLMTGGVGSLAGYLACGAWLTSCSYAGRTDWPKYWAGLSLPMAAILMFFLLTYRGKRQ